MFKKKSILLYAMLINWIVVVIIGVVTGIILRDLRGIEWFGSPLLACILMGIIITVLYLTTKNRDWKITEIIVFWFAIFFFLTIINMATLAKCILGTWEDFQAMPIMGTFQLLLLAIAFHLQFSVIRKKALNIFTLWTTVLFLFTLSSMVFLALSIFGRWESDFQQYPIIGIGIWTGLMFILYLTPKGDQMSTPKVFFFWSWFMFVGVGISMVLTYVCSIAGDPKIWPIYPALGTFGLALLATILMIISSKLNGEPSDKIDTLNE